MFKSILDILVVEDSEIDFLAVKRHLNWSSRCEFRLTRVGAVDEAMAACKVGQYDCALIDYRLNDTHGFNLLARLGGRKAPFPVIILAGHQIGPQAGEDPLEGAFDLIEKTALTQQLLQRTIFYAIDHFGLQARLRETLDRAEESVAVTSHMLSIVDGALLPQFEALLDTIARETGRESSLTREATGVFSLLQNLVDFRRLQEGSISFDHYDADPVGVLERCILRATSARDLPEIRLEIAPALAAAPGFAGDEARLEQLVGNLFSWLVRESGASVLSVDAGLEHGALRLDFGLSGDADTDRILGQGQRADLPRTTSHDPAATLDVTVAKELARQMGGTLAETQVEDGLVLTITLPQETLLSRRFQAIRSALASCRSSRDRRRFPCRAMTFRSWTMRAIRFRRTRSATS